LALVTVISEICLAYPIDEFVDRGDFTVQFEEFLYIDPADSGYFIQISERVRDAVNAMNNSFIMPEGIEIIFRDSGGPSYDLFKREIIIGYDFVSQVSGLALNSGIERKLAEVMVADVVEFALYFEMSRALLDVWKAPLHRAQWESEKQLAIMLVSWMTIDRDIILNVSRFHRLFIESGGFEDTPHEWDEFILFPEMVISTLKFFIGWDPVSYSWVVKESILSRMDIEDSGCYYEDLSRRWGNFTTPYIKD
jgi:hypothetical protein